MSDETPRFRLIKGGRLDFSTDQLLAIDVLLREKLQPLARYGWVLHANGALVSSCGNPVMELSSRVGEVTRSIDPSQPIVTGLTVPLPDGPPSPLVAVRIDSSGILVATCVDVPLSPQDGKSLLEIAGLLRPIFDAARVQE